MKGFISSSGRYFTDSQRKAMFSSRVRDSKLSLEAIATKAVIDTADSKFKSKPTPELKSKPTPELKSKNMGVGNVTGKAVNIGMPLAISVAGGVTDEALGLGAPYTPTNSEFLKMDENVVWSSVMPKEPRGDEIDVDVIRNVIKKQYPDADVDTGVVMLSSDKYMDVALSQNPGREKEALSSNGFYSPSTDMSYLAIDTDGLNTTRAMIHEMVHDMSDDGVGNDVYNEGYADYVAFKIMTEELDIPTTRAKQTLGYPREMEMISKLVDKNGREEVDKAFLKYHNLDKLGVRSAL